MDNQIEFYCYFDCPKRSIIKLNIYVEAIGKSIDVFDDAHIKEEVEGYCQKIDIGDGFGYAEEKYKDLLWAKKQVMNMATVGLYHLWEKTIRDFFVAQLRNYQLETAKADENLVSYDDLIMRAKFSTIKKALFPCLPLRKSLEQIAELSSVVNVLKHGEGNSFYSLLKKAPDLINNTLYAHEKIEVSNEKFEAYHQALQDFWNNFPEAMRVQFKI